MRIDLPTLKRHARRVGLALRRLKFRRGGERSLADRLMGLLLLATAFMYITINAGLWWTSARMIDDSLARQAERWVAEFDDLGTPLFVSRGGQQLVRVDERIKNFPEIAYVRYFDARGRLLGSYGSAPPKSIATDEDRRAAAEAALTEGRRYVIERGISPGGVARVVAPVSVRAIRADGLFGISLAEVPSESVKVVGYLEFGLDGAAYREAFVRSMQLGGLVIALVFALALVAGRRLILRALAPLRALQMPLARLAQGETDVQVAPAGDREIAAIGSALNVTITAIRQRDEELRRLAENDPLTGLVNRGSFMRELENERERLAATGGHSAVMFFDLDQFKYVNDTLGHAVGDRLLMQVANVLRGRTRGSDVVSRFGGDEFLVLARDAGVTEASALARSLNEIMRDFSLVEGGHAVTVNFSIGITVFDGRTSSNEEILAQADMACYAAKTRGRNRFQVYQPGEEERARMTTDIGWSQLVKEAIRDDRFRLVYQPIEDVRPGAVEHYEVLLRLPTDSGEVVMPSVFLPVAQRFGLLAEIDRWVISHALQTLAAFRAEGRNICFSINLSAQGLEDAALLELVGELLQQHRLPPEAVVFEITEQTAVRYLDHARHVLQGLVALGCRLALDDFGKGFSSLSYLKHLPVEFIKIDGAFVCNLGDDPIDQAMVRAIVQVAQALGKRTIAEFVQDARAVQLLREAGVDYLQGYFIGRPAEELPLLPLVAASA